MKLKYGIVTNDFGTIIVKTDDKCIEINKKKSLDIFNNVYKIKRGMIKDFKNKYNQSFDKNNYEDNKLISEMIDKNKEKYINQYQEVLNDYGITIKFINIKRYNN